MFSVSASPFNSRLNAIYGGWVPSTQAADPSIGAEGLRAFYAQNGQQAYLDGKWADLALKYSANPMQRVRAKRIKAAQKKQLATWKKDAAWHQAYYDAIKKVKYPYKRKSMTADAKAKLWDAFVKTPFGDDMTLAEKAALAAISEAPFTSVPQYAELSPAVADLITTGPTIPIAIDPVLKYTPKWENYSPDEQRTMLEAYRTMYGKPGQPLTDEQVMEAMRRLNWYRN